MSYAFGPTKIPEHKSPLYDVEMAAKYGGSRYFEPATMRFFKSRAPLAVVQASRNWSACYFTTSERGPYGPRGYSVRLARWVRGRLHIDTVGGFMSYKTARAAEREARRLAAGGRT